MIQLTDAAVLVNDEVVAIDPNSLKFKEGFGARTMRSASIGEGKVEQVYANDAESAIGMVSFSLPTTPANIKLVRSWLVLENGNVVGIAGSTKEGDVTKTFTQAAITNDPEVNVGADGSIEVEFQSNKAV